MTCPECASDRAFPSRPKGHFEQLLGVFSLYPCRCHKCNHRYLRSRYFILKAGETDPLLISRQNRDWRVLRWIRLIVFIILGAGLIAAFIGSMSPGNS